MTRSPNLPTFLPLKNPPIEHVRKRCYGCFRPESSCFGDAIPTVFTQTNLLILQHRDERTHPFNSARIVHQALENCELIVGRNSELANMDLGFSENAGLLYPHWQSKPLTDLPPSEMPKQLVFLDGTWNHARTMYRDIDALKTLPCYRLTPETPSRYRIRKEPTRDSLSTLEAIVLVLKQVEPELEGLDLLIAAFDLMNQQQVDELKRRNVQLRGRQTNF